MVIFPFAPDQTIAHMWSSGARGGCGGGAKGKAPLKCFNRGWKHLFAPQLICQVYQLVTQFCIAALPESASEELKMHQNSWRPLGELTSLPQPLPSYCPLLRNNTPAQPFGLRARFVPTMLILFRSY